MELSESPLKEKESERIDMQTNEGIESGQRQVEGKKSCPKEVLEKSHDVCVEVKKGSEETIGLNQVDEHHHPKTEQEALEKPREIAEEQAVEEKSEEEEEEDFVIVTVTPEEMPEVITDDAIGSVEERYSEEYSNAYSVKEVKMHLEEGAQGTVTEYVVPEVQELIKVTSEEKLGFSQNQEKVASVICELEAEHAETTEAEVKKPLKQDEVKDSELLIQHSCTETDVLEAPIQKKSIDVPVKDDEWKVSDMGVANDAALGLETGSTQEVAVGVGMQNKETEVSAENVETEIHVQKIDPKCQLQELETKASLVDVKPEPLLMNLEAQIHAEMVGKEISVKKMDVPKQKIEAEDHIEKVETNGHIEEVEGKSHILSVGTEILAEKSELEVDIDVSSEETKTESIRAKADVEEQIKEIEAHISSEDAYSKLAVESAAEKVEEEIAQPVTEVKSEALKEKMEVEAPTEDLKAASTDKGDVTLRVEAATEKTDAKVEAEISTEKTDAKAEAEICTEETDIKIDGESCTEKADATVKEETVSLSKHTDENLKEELPSTAVDIELSVEKVGAEIAKDKNEVEASPVKEDVGHSTEEAKAEASIKQTEGETLTEKTDVDVPIETTDAKADSDLFAEKTNVKVCEKQSKEMMEAEASTKLTEPKEALQKIENDSIVQPAVKDTATSLATCVEVVSAEAPVGIVSEQESVISDMIGVPVQGETQVTISLESRSFDGFATEEHVKSEREDAFTLEKVSTEKGITQEQGLLEVSPSKLDKVDLTQMVVTDASLVLESQITEGIEAEVQESDELKDITIVKSKCTKESISDTPVQMEMDTPPMKEVKILKSLGITASEASVQSEKEDVLTSGSKYMDVNVVEDSVQNEAVEDSVIKETAAETESSGTLISTVKAEGDGGILTSDSGYAKSLSSNAILENLGESTPADDKEASINGISMQIHTCPDKLLTETVHLLSESTIASDSCQRMQALPEKMQIMDTEKLLDNIELAGGDVLHAAPVQQKIFAEQQEIVTMDIPEAQSYTVHKSSVTVTATEVEEQVSTGKATLKETSAEIPQSLLEETKETAFQMVQQVSFVHSGLGAPGLDTKVVSEKTHSEAEEPVLPAASFIKDDFLSKSGLDSIPKMKLQKSETSEEAEKQMTSPARSPSLTHIEFEKDVVQSVTIESQSTKIVLKIIQNAVDKLEKTEEPIFSSQSQQTEPCPLHPDKSEIQEDLQKQEATEEMSLSTAKCEVEGSSGTRKTAVDLEAVKYTPQTDEQSRTSTLMPNSGSLTEAVKEIIKEESLQKENDEPKHQSAIDTTVPTQTQGVVLEGIVSGDLPRESPEADPPKLKDVDVGQIQEQLIVQQTPVKRKEDHSPSTEFVETHSEKDVNNQGSSSHESPQLKSELTES